MGNALSTETTQTITTETTLGELRAQYTGAATVLANFGVDLSTAPWETVAEFSARYGFDEKKQQELLSELNKLESGTKPTFSQKPAGGGGGCGCC